MPPWNALGDATVRNLLQYVLRLSGQPHDVAAATAGQPVFETTCGACHGPNGTGNPQIGAPNLTDGTWLYGGARDTIEQSIRNGRTGHMPAWSPRLSDDDIHILAGYVLHLSQRGDVSTR